MKIACFTIVRNEQIRLPIWYKYYSQFFSDEHIYIIDNGSEQPLKIGSTNFSTLSFHGMDHERINKHVKEFQKELLKKYDWVIFAEVDEFLVVDPDHGNLLSFMEEYDKKPEVMIHKARGYNVIHSKTEEPPLDLSKPVLGQRKYWRQTSSYDKPLISRISIDWDLGFHGFVEEDISLELETYDPRLYLIHLHYWDYDLTKARNRDFIKGGRSKNEEGKPCGAQNFYEDDIFEADFRITWFSPSPPLQIPERFHGIL